MMSKRYKITLLDTQTLGVAKEESILLLKTDMSSATELALPFTFSNAGISKKHDFMGNDHFYVFGDKLGQYG